MPAMANCKAKARHKKVKYGSNHTFECQKPEGHDGAHEWKDDCGRTVIWFGEARQPDESTRFRFGHWVQS